MGIDISFNIVTFDEILNPYCPTIKTLNIQNLSNKPNVFCLLKLENDEYWRYTKFGDFSDFFKFEYIVNSNLIIKSSDSKNYSEEIKIDISQNEDRVIENSIGKFKINYVSNEIKPFMPSNNWKCNLFIEEIKNTIKKKDVLWLVEINGNSLGYSYDGIINKYISININSLQSDEIKLALYECGKGSKKEFAKGSIKISKLHFGIIEEKNIDLLDTSKEIKLKLHITPPNSEPFVNQLFNPLILHIYVIEALNVPKMDFTSKTDPYVVIRFEKDKVGVRTRALPDTLTPQWNELLDYIITNHNESLLVEIWDENDVVKDKMISSTKLNIEKYLSEEPQFEWIKINKMLLNLVIHIKPLGENFISKDEVYYTLSRSVVPNIE